MDVNKPGGPSPENIQPPSNQTSQKKFPHPEQNSSDSKAIPAHDSKAHHGRLTFKELKKFLNKQKPKHGISGYNRFMLTLLNQTRLEIKKWADKAHETNVKIRENME